MFGSGERHKQSSPFLAQQSLRSFYEQTGSPCRRPITIIDNEVVKNFSKVRNSPDLEYKNKDMLTLEMALQKVMHNNN